MYAARGKNLVQIKRQNMESIKTILYRYAPLSRAEISEKLELTPPTISNIVAELIQDGVVQELPPEASPSVSQGVGRKPVNIDLVPKSRLALGIYLGRDNTYYCITHLRGGILAQGITEVMPDNYDDMVNHLLRLLNSLKQKYSAYWQLLIGIGLTAPGIIDSQSGIFKHLGFERISWHNRPLAETISQATQLPVSLENNVQARACAISLFHPELLGDSTSFAFCHVSWGIACSIVLNNHFVKGDHSAAGEIGKMIMDPYGDELENCGMPGSLESLSSTRAILARCRQAANLGKCPVLRKQCPDIHAITLEQVLNAQKAGDPDVGQILNRGMVFLGLALANLVDFINPHLIFLSGPVFSNPANFEIVQITLHTHAFRSSDEDLQLVSIDFGEYGDAIGAAAVCIEKSFLCS